MANAGQGGGGQSAYKSGFASLTGQNSATGIDPIVEVSYTSAEEGAGNEIVAIKLAAHNFNGKLLMWSMVLLFFTFMVMEVFGFSAMLGVPME